jgi:hypothetical protein
VLRSQFSQISDGLTDEYEDLRLTYTGQFARGAATLSILLPIMLVLFLLVSFILIFSLSDEGFISTEETLRGIGCLVSV